MVYLLARALMFLSVTLGGSFAFLAMTTPGNSETVPLLSYGSEEYRAIESELTGRLTEVH